MSDRIREFIKQNRAEFDTLEPRAETWGEVRKSIRPQSKTSFYWLWKAAAVLLLASTLGLVIERQLFRNGQAPSEQYAHTQELDRVESYYSEIILAKRTEIKRLIEEKDLDVQLLKDLDDLDLMYNELKEDLKTNQNNEKLINAMIRNLQLRVEILNKQLGILKQLEKNEQNETVI